ncbi:MAG TPA: uroporphyrinogen decarboxylase family protein [Actinomycetota bacterium]|nr:uroporphyrinogen decarboxylase family protein [Actinomycetota bacterium]
MDSTSRVRAALALERPDRPPVGWWGHTYREEWSPAELAAATVARQRTYGWDFVKLQPRASCFAEAFGSEYRPSSDASAGPVLVRPAVLGSNDWSRVPAVDSGVPALGDQVETLRIVAGELGASVPVIQTVFSPLTVAGYLAGEDRTRMAGELRGRSEPVQDALARIGDALADLAVRSVAAGAAGIFYAISDLASTDLLSLDEYEELALEHDVRVLSSLPEGAWFNVLHLCGPRLNFELGSRLDAHAVSWSIHEAGNPSLAEGRSRAGRAVMGGVDLETLARGTPEAIVEQSRAAISDTRSVGLLLAPGCSVPPEASEENLRAIAGAVAAER